MVISRNAQSISLKSYFCQFVLFLMKRHVQKDKTFIYIAQLTRFFLFVSVTLINKTKYRIYNNVKGTAIKVKSK